MKIAILNDTHAGIRNSSQIMMNYQEQFYRDVFFPYLLENDIKKVIHLGDYYDNRQNINFKALKHNRMIFLEKLREYDIHMEIIPGNHDVFYKSTNDLSALNELLGHYMKEVMIVERPTVRQYGSLKMALIPWINNENEKATRAFIDHAKVDVVGAHLELQGFEMQRGVAAHDGMDASVFNKFEMVLSGHYHTKSTQGNIHYLGTQMEFFWSDADDPKYFHVLDTETRELTPVHNPITLFERIYYDDTKVKDYETMDLQHLDNKFVKIVVLNKSDTRIFDRFIDRIQNRSIHELKIAENFAEFVGENVEDDKISLENTENLLASYIDAVETDLDKDRIKSEVHDLMIQAQTFEIV